MTNALLFLGTVVLWGSAAIVTAQQAVSAEPAVSVGWRMAIVAAAMFAWCLARGTPLAVAREHRGWIALQGVLFFGLSFVTFYTATALIPSGIAALILSTSSLVAAVAAALFLRAPTTPQLVIGLCIGIGGLGIVVLPQILAFEATAGSLPGFLWALAAATCTGCGTVVAARNQRAGLPIATIMGWSALAGSAFAFGWGIAVGGELLPAATVPYLAGLLYLAILASCATFAMYFALVRRIGPAAASYALSAVPLVAIVLSIQFEGLRLDSFVVAGCVAIVWGNVVVLGSANAASRARAAARERAQSAPGKS